MIYFDNNATTFMPDNVKRALIESLDQGNPSGDYMIAKASKKIIENAKKKIATLCNINIDDYTIMFNSGASEGNNFILHSLAESNNVPHFILSSIEHKTSINCCKELSKRGLITYTLIDPEIDGTVDPKKIIMSIQPNTMLISIMVANNETGAINDISTISRYIQTNNLNILFHSDYVQLFGKAPPNISKINIDAITVSFHKLYGPTQCGFLLISKNKLQLFHLCPMIAGSQNDGWRGGTESVFLTAAALEAMNTTFTNRTEKNNKLFRLKLLMLDMFNIYNVFWLSEICCLNDYYKQGINIVIYGPKNLYLVLPNTLLLSIVYVTKDVDVDNMKHCEVLCNIKLKKMLYDRNVIISLGSACNKGAASYVLESMHVTDEKLKQSVVRISFGDYNTPQEVIQFCNILHDILTNEFSIYN